MDRDPSSDKPSRKDTTEVLPHAGSEYLSSCMTLYGSGPNLFCVFLPPFVGVKFLFFKYMILGANIQLREVLMH